MGFIAKTNIGGTEYLMTSSLYGKCTTAADVAAKVVGLSDFTTLINGATIAIRFTNTNEAANPTLNVNGTGAKSILTNNNNRPGVKPPCSWVAGSVVEFVYEEDSDIWRMISPTVVDLIYPVGSIYLSVNSTNPGTLFGGSWTQIKDRFLLSAGDTYSAGSTGGAETVTLTANNIPAHTHSIAKITNGTAESAGAHVHGAWYASDSSPNRDWGCEWHNGAKAAGSSSAGMDSAGAHTHTVTIPAHNTGNNTTTGAAVNKMPPYLAVYVWQRTA